MYYKYISCGYCKPINPNQDECKSSGGTWYTTEYNATTLKCFNYTTNTLTYTNFGADILNYKVSKLPFLSEKYSCSSCGF